MQTDTDSGIIDARLYSVRDAAAALGGLSKFTVASWLSKGKICRTKCGSRTLIRGSELKKVLIDGGKSPGRPRQPKEDTIPALER
jgi:hypothetical protein